MTISVILGCVGWSCLATIGARVDSAEVAERLIRQSDVGQLSQRDYMLRRTKANLTTRKRSLLRLTSLRSSLEKSLTTEADRAAATAADQQFDVWLATLQDYARCEDEKTAAEAQMSAAAGSTDRQCGSLRDSQSTELTSEQRANAQRNADMLWKADAANRLIKIALTARVAERDYMNTKAAEALEKNHQAMKVSSERSYVSRGERI